MLGHHALRAHEADMPEQVRAYLALFEIGQEDAVHTPRQEPGEVGACAC